MIEKHRRAGLKDLPSEVAAAVILASLVKDSLSVWIALDGCVNFHHLSSLSECFNFKYQLVVKLGDQQATHITACKHEVGCEHSLVSAGVTRLALEG